MKISPAFRHDTKMYISSYLPEVIVQNTHFSHGVDEGLDDLIELASEEVCLSRKKGLALSGDVADLAERVLHLSDGREFIAGARFKNLDPSFPFVEIQKTFPLTSQSIFEMSELILTEFRSLKPKGFKFKDRPGIHPTLEKWSHVVFGSVPAAREFETVSPPGLNFSLSSSLDWHPRYVQEYRERLSEKPELGGFVRIGEFGEFKEAVAHGALLLATDSEGFAGVFAGIESRIYGLRAVYMIESYLSKRWIGKRAAPQAHGHFFRGVETRFQHVWGTIYDQNTSSLKTALRTGRKIIETEYFAPVEASVI